MRLLCAADLHLGRQPSRVPGHLADLAPEVSAAAAWRRLVRLAVEERVAAVLLAGDVVEDEHDYFEAYEDLRRGAQELAEAGIALVAVAGNHDVGVLPRLARSVPGVRLLGEGGRWEAVTLRAAGASVNVVGWSWPGARVTASPAPGAAAALASLPPAPVIGLLHCDLDASGTAYAPVRRAELEALPVDAWLLGHVHKPSLRAGNDGRWLGYLGCVAAADPGEEGPRGAWLVTVRGGAVEAEHVPLAPLLFDTVEVDVSEAAEPSDVSALIVAAVEAHADEAATLGERGPAAVGLRVRVVGRHERPAEVEAHLSKEDPRRLGAVGGRPAGFVHGVACQVYPRLDVSALARAEGPMALMARRLLVLDGPPTPERDALLAAGREAMLAAAAHASYRSLEPPRLDDDAVADALRRAAARLLAEMAS